MEEAAHGLILQGLPQVLDEVFRVFDTHGVANQPIGLSSAVIRALLLLVMTPVARRDFPALGVQGGRGGV